MSIAERSCDNPNDLRSVDRELLVVMRRMAGSGTDTIEVGQLTDALGVTSTAVRQRIERLLAMGLIEREKVVAGRGRPVYHYRLTVAGHRSAGANATALADAMWREILELDDTAVRQKLLNGIGARLGRQYAADLRVTDVTQTSDEVPESVDVRMQRLSEILASRHVVNQISMLGELPVLDIGACPYPTLTDVSDDRSMCRLEEQMFSEALGQPVHLSSCRLDGDSCCQFSPVKDSVQESSSSVPDATASEQV
ncbi:MAG: ArsR family transcriptional regulator [Pirellulaceae bacterium]